VLRVTLVCIGRVRAGPERDLAERYLDRARAAGRAAGFGFDVRELDESRARRSDERKAEEAASIKAAVGPGTPVLVFDEAGEPLDSPAFADRLRRTRDRGDDRLALVIGGPDGLSAELRNQALGAIALGRMTWPHQLVRILVAEQLYRAVTILTGHPYHRA
jgi:23S rRNA (pseudouridine1915-N3)-methyltransferase